MYRKYGIQRCQGWQGAVMYRMYGIKRAHGCAGAVVFQAILIELDVLVALFIKIVNYCLCPSVSIANLRNSQAHAQTVGFVHSCALDVLRSCFACM